MVSLTFNSFFLLLTLSYCFSYSLSGGLTNHLFLCSLPRDCKNKVSMNKVLLRLYGAFYSEMSENRFRMMEECLVCGLLAEKNMGPALYGIFPEGRLEQYIPNVSQQYGHITVTRALTSLKVMCMSLCNPRTLDKIFFYLFIYLLNFNYTDLNILYKLKIN